MFRARAKASSSRLRRYAKKRVARRPRVSPRAIIRAVGGEVKYSHNNTGWLPVDSGGIIQSCQWMNSGSSQGQRIGNRIRIVKIQFNYVLATAAHSGGAIADFADLNNLVRVFMFKRPGITLALNSPVTWRNAFFLPTSEPGYVQAFAAPEKGTLLRDKCHSIKQSVSATTSSGDSPNVLRVPQYLKNRLTYYPKGSKGIIKFADGTSDSVVDNGHYCYVLSDSQYAPHPEIMYDIMVWYTDL